MVDVPVVIRRVGGYNYLKETSRLMMIKFCSLFSGSSGNSLFITDGQTRILIDAGISGIRIKKALESIGEDPHNLDALVVTHEHSDHTKCAGVITRRYKIPVYATKGTWNGMSPYIGPVNEANVMYIKADNDFQIKTMTVRPFKIPHDANDPVGFSFFAEGKKVTVATDIGVMTEALQDNIRGSDLLMLESNHDIEMLDNGRYPYYLKKRIKSDHGHLCNEMAGITIAKLVEQGARKFVIGHLSQENNTPDVAYATVASYISGNGFDIGNTVELYVARRDETSRVFEV
jgi:phosphoribosyl 1,2-cyclic phosphodiesterase